MLQYLIVLKDSDGKEYSSRVLSEGTLRILALCVIWLDDKYEGLLCFEEPENGVHPSRISSMATLLSDLVSDFTQMDNPLRQVIINTHSTVFIRQMNKMINNPNLSIYFVRMVRRVLTHNSVKTNLLATVASAVPKDLSMQIPFSDYEMKLSAQMLEDFLENESRDVSNSGYQL